MTIKKAVSLFLTGCTLGMVAVVSGFAYEVKENPDRFPSIGVSMANGKLAGIRNEVPPGTTGTNGGYIRWGLDYRFPYNSYVTFNAGAELTGVNNNKDYTNGHQLNVGMRVYLR